MKFILIGSISVLFSFYSINFWGQTEEGDWRVFPGSNSTTNSAETPSMNKKELNFSSKEGVVTVSQSSEIDSLSTKMKAEPFIYGYTIQIEVSQQKSVIQSAKYRIMNMEPNAPFDEVYVSPNIYLYVGRFYDRLSAYEFRNKIISYYPNSIVIGPKKMDLPPIIREESVIIAPENNSTGN